MAQGQRVGQHGGAVVVGALFSTVFGAFLIYLGTVTKPWRTVKDRPRAQWTGDVAGSLLIAGIGVLALFVGWGAPLWLLRAFVCVWLLLLAGAAAAWLWAHWRESRAPQPVARHAPRPVSALGAVLAWLAGLPVVVAVAMTLSLYLWHRLLAPSAAQPVSSADLAAALAPPLLVATVVTAPFVWLAQAVRRQAWEERQRAHELRLTGLDVPPLPSRWSTIRRVLGF